MDPNGDGRARIELGRLRFLGREALVAKTDLAAFLDHCYELGYSVPPDQHRAALETYTFLEDFARDALA